MRNILLAEVCRKLPQTLARLREIEGIVEATCAKYGKDILGLIAPFAARTSEEYRRKLKFPYSRGLKPAPIRGF